MLPVYSNSFWTEECAGNIFMRSHCSVQRTHSQVFGAIIGFKEIMMKSGETSWELDQRLKCKICKSNMNLTDGQHHEWFVASLLPHLRVCFSQQNIGT